MCFLLGRPTAQTTATPTCQRKADVVSSPLTHSGLRKMPPSKNKLQTKTQNPSNHLHLIRRVSSRSSTNASDIAKADHKNLERSSVRDPGNEVPQAKEQEIGKSGVDAIAATQGPAEQ